LRNFVLALAAFITSSISFAGDLPLQLEPLSRANLHLYKTLLERFAAEDQDKGFIDAPCSKASLTAKVQEIDELAERGLYDIRTLFTDWLVVDGGYVIGLYSIHIPSDEFSLDTDDLLSPSPLPVTVLDRLYSSKYPFRGADPAPGYSVTSLRLLKGKESAGIKEAIEEALVRPHYHTRPYVPFYSGGRFAHSVTKHPFVGVTRG
jgi:hypothetical protein